MTLFRLLDDSELVEAVARLASRVHKLGADASEQAQFYAAALDEAKAELRRRARQ